MVFIHKFFEPVTSISATFPLAVFFAVLIISKDYQTATISATSITLAGWFIAFCYTIGSILLGKPGNERIRELANLTLASVVVPIISIARINPHNELPFFLALVIIMILLGTIMGEIKLPDLKNKYRINLIPFIIAGGIMQAVIRFY
jgi:hypothetical protein